MASRSITLFLGRFLVGGMVVAAVSLIETRAPRISGLLAGFPAVFLTALLFIHWFGGKKEAMRFSSTALYGMFGGVLTVLTVIVGLMAQWPWPLVVVLGGLSYVAFVIVMVYRERRMHPHPS
ncbi:MAG: DUF3147 family protein [Sulfobacillus sp.]